MNVLNLKKFKSLNIIRIIQFTKKGFNELHKIFKNNFILNANILS